MCKQANYEGALDRIRHAFTLDVFADPPQDAAQLEQDKQQALALFLDYFKTTQTPHIPSTHPNNPIHVVVAQSLIRYKEEIDKDLHRLKLGFAEAEDTMNQACLCIWKLFIEWTHIAQKKVKNPQFNKNSDIDASTCLARNRMLQCLQKDASLARLIQQQGAGWEERKHLVRGWYNEFVKNDLMIQQDLICPITPEKDQQLLVYLIEKIIFSKKRYSRFFQQFRLKLGSP